MATQEYTAYKDVNGVTWTIIIDGNRMVARIADPPKTARTYDEGSTEFEVEIVPRNIVTDFIDKHILAKDTNAPTGAEVAENQRKVWAELREKIDAYAKAHSGEVNTIDEVINVTGTKPAGGGWVWVLLGVLLLASKKRKRRKR